MEVDFGAYDPASFARPGGDDLTVDLNHLVITDVVCLSTGTEMECMVHFSHGLGFWMDLTGHRRETVTPVQGVICWTGALDQTDPDVYISTYMGTIEWWANQVMSLRLTAAVERSALLVAQDGWVSIPSGLTIDVG